MEIDAYKFAKNVMRNSIVISEPEKQSKLMIIKLQENVKSVERLYMIVF